MVEQTIGILKKRFAILHGEVCLEPERAVQVITTCIILHNIGMLHEELRDVGDIPLPPPAPPANPHLAPVDAAVRRHRDIFIERVFADA